MGVAAAVRGAVAVAGLRQVEAPSVGDTTGAEGTEAVLPPEGDEPDTPSTVLATAVPTNRGVEVINDLSYLVRLRLGTGAKRVAVPHLSVPARFLTRAPPRGGRSLIDRLLFMVSLGGALVFRVQHCHLIHQV